MPYNVTTDEVMQRLLHWYNGWSRAHFKALVAIEHGDLASAYRDSHTRQRMLDAHARLLRHLMSVDELKHQLIADGSVGYGRCSVLRAGAPNLPSALPETHNGNLPAKTVVEQAP